MSTFCSSVLAARRLAAATQRGQRPSFGRTGSRHLSGVSRNADALMAKQNAHAVNLCIVRLAVVDAAVVAVHLGRPSRLAGVALLAELNAMEDVVESTADRLIATAERLRSDFQQHRQVRRSTRRPVHRPGGQLTDGPKRHLLIYRC